MKGYAGAALHIDLGGRKISKKQLDRELVQTYIGGKGTGNVLNYMYNRKVFDPLSAENTMVIATGPGGGTSLPTATKLGLFARAPLNDVVMESYLGGSFGHFMRKAGCDVIIIQGAAERPVFLKIIDQQVSLENASWLWGKDIYQTEDLLKQNVGSRAKILSIGPAGENLVRYACIGHNRHRHFGRMGAGALMGSKKLKAIALVGTGEVEVHDRQGFKNYVKQLNKRIKQHPATGEVYPMAGTVNFVSKANALGVFPSHYWYEGQARYKDRIDFNYMQKHTLVKQTRCFGCPIGCAHINRIKDGPHAGIQIDGPEFETIYVFGGLCDVSDLSEIIWLNDLCDRLGVDTMHAGNVLGLLMSATEQNRVPAEYRIQFGDTEKMALFIKNIARREKNWFIMGEGLKRIARKLNLSDLAIHVKGLEPAGYDPRGVQSMAVTYGISNRGATHLSSNSYARDISGAARDFELEGEDKTLERLSVHRKGELVYNMVNFNAIADCFILCRFLNRDLLTWEDYSESLYLLTGMEKTKKQLTETANNIITMGRWFNMETMLNSSDDLLPERFYTQPIISMGSRGAVVDKGEYLKELKQYYSLRNWNEQGMPNFRPPLPGI
ncbi:MAG: aldehyde ferredoxin oxidoreductase family protein [Spirochaetota bacterium]